MARLLRLLGPFRGRFALSVLLGTFAAAAGVALLATSGYLISAAALRPPILDLFVAIVAVRAFSLGRAVTRYLERLVSHDLAFRLLADLRVWLYRRLEPLAPAGLEEFRSGDLLDRLVADVEGLQDFFLRVLAPPLTALAVLIGTSALLWLLAPAAILWFAGPFLLAAAALPWMARRLSRRPAARAATARAGLTAELVELIQAAPEIAAYDLQSEWAERVRARDEELARASTRVAAIGGLGEAGGMVLAGIATAGVLGAAVMAVRAGHLSGVGIAAAGLAALAAFEAAQVLPGAFARLEQSMAGARRLFELGDRPSPVVRPARPAAAEPGEITLRDAWLRYDGPWVLEGLDLQLRPGERVALLGPTGSGKTSVASVLLRFRDLDRGQARLAGRDLRELDPEGVRRVIGLCAQDPHLFNTSVLENVRMARPEAELDEIEAAARRARILEWVHSLPSGWDTVVGEQGALVSAGQRQRIALARALLAGFPILILDEPTANLDPPTADALMRDVLDAAAGRTILLITHRTEGLDRMDRVQHLRSASELVA